MRRGFDTCLKGQTGLYEEKTYKLQYKILIVLYSIMYVEYLTQKNNIGSFKNSTFLLSAMSITDLMVFLMVRAFKLTYRSSSL